MGETMDKFATAGRKNVFGQVVKAITTAAGHGWIGRFEPQKQLPFDSAFLFVHRFAMAILCPICFEEHKWSHTMWYERMDNHSWDNSTLCDAHGICRQCICRYIELQILEEGHFNPRCPGENCSYRLVPVDVERALEWSYQKSEALDRWHQLRSECHEGRLKELLSHQGATEAWLLSESQPCPQCLTLVRREEGCLHVFCRCGCDFCFGCGGPQARCICHHMEKPNGSLVFAAWLRTSSASPFEWLWDSRSMAEKEERLLGTLHFWLWMARAEVPVPWKEPVEATTAELVQGLDPIKWWRETEEEEADWDYLFFEYCDRCICRCHCCRCGEGDDVWGFQYHRMPQKPIHLAATGRQSRRQDRHWQRPLRWALRREVSNPDVEGQTEKILGLQNGLCRVYPAARYLK
eukprot:Skav225102  [mRNA]  locus=scaffold3924:9557:11723:- [translate_table: standard]